MSLYHKVLPLESSNFVQRLQAVENRIHSALERSGRTRSDLTLVAVSKKFSAGSVREAYQAGIREFGENYVQEFEEKRRHLNDLPEARFHFIGHLQSNKARLACELFQVIQTADSVKVLERLNAGAAERGERLEVLIEVKLSGEDSKTGTSAGSLPEMLRAGERQSNLNITGLMTMPPWSENPEDSRPYFQELAQAARRLGLPQLSMGMSGDLEVAIEEGATLVRVGTALFGARPKPETLSAAT